MAAQRKQSRPTVPAMPDPAVAAFEERISQAGEWRARVENLCAIVEEETTGVMHWFELDQLRARCMHD